MDRYKHQNYLNDHAKHFYLITSIFWYDYLNNYFAIPFNFYNAYPNAVK